MVSGPPVPCRDCGLPISFLKSESTGRTMVIDLSPDPDKGNVAKVWRHGHALARVLGPDTAAQARAAGRLLWTAHQYTCLARKPHNPRPMGLFPVP